MTPGIRVLDHGKVSLIDALGGDLDVVNAARVSFSAYQSKMDEKAEGLINFLMKNKHATPFEHITFKFYVKCPIFVAREWFRHRWSSFNEMSMRYYVPDELEFYIPEFDAVRKQVGKPGHYEFETIEDETTVSFVQDKMSLIYATAEAAYYDLLDAGVAKEIARCVLPVGQYTEFIWTVNLRSLLNFIALRNDSNAQLEIRQFAEAIEEFAESVAPVCLKSFVSNGRQAI